MLPERLCIAKLLSEFLSDGGAVASGTPQPKTLHMFNTPNFLENLRRLRHSPLLPGKPKFCLDNTHSALNTTTALTPISPQLARVNKHFQPRFGNVQSLTPDLLRCAMRRIREHHNICYDLFSWMKGLINPSRGCLYDFYPTTECV